VFGSSRYCIARHKASVHAAYARRRQFVLGGFAERVRSARPVSERKRRNSKTNAPLFRKFEARDCAGRQATGCVEGPRRIKRDGRSARFASSSAFSLTHSLTHSLSFSLPPSLSLSLSFLSHSPSPLTITLSNTCFITSLAFASLALVSLRAIN